MYLESPALSHLQIAVTRGRNGTALWSSMHHTASQQVGHETALLTSCHLAEEDKVDATVAASTCNPPPRMNLNCHACLHNSIAALAVNSADSTGSVAAEAPNAEAECRAYVRACVQAAQETALV